MEDACRAGNAPLTYFRKVPLLAQPQRYHINDRTGPAVKENRTALCVSLELKASSRCVCVCVCGRHLRTGFPGGSDGKESACHAGDPGSIPGWKDALEKGMATHSSSLTCRIPWTEEPGGLQSLGRKESDTTE